MLCNYNTSPKVIANEEKKENEQTTPQTTRESSRRTSLNNNSTDDKAENENERIRKILMSTAEAMKNVDREYEEKMRMECTLRNNKFIVYK